MSRNSPTWPPELATPIVLRLTGDLESDRALIQRAACERLAKLPALAKHYGIEIDSPQAVIDLMSPLTLALAEQHVPGFRIKIRADQERKGRGRPRDGATDARLMIARAIWEEVFDASTARRLAIEEVALDDLWRRKPLRRAPMKAINARVKTLTNRMPGLASDEHREFGRFMLEELKRVQSRKLKK